MVIYVIKILLCRFNKKMEINLYNAALAVTCTIRGSSREKLHQQGLETLQQRRWYRKCFFFGQNAKIAVSKVSLFSHFYTQYVIQNKCNKIPVIQVTHDFLNNSFFPSTIIE